MIVNMAAQAFNSTSWEAEHYTYLVNIRGTHNVLAAAHVRAEAKLLLACSSAEYGDVKPEIVAREDMPINP